MLTSTGKKQSTAAMKIFEPFSIPNQAFAIGAKAMIGIAFAAMKYGISAAADAPEARQHERDERCPRSTR